MLSNKCKLNWTNQPAKTIILGRSMTVRDRVEIAFLQTRPADFKEERISRIEKDNHRGTKP
jgi:hypothetical protein